MQLGNICPFFIVLRRILSKKILESCECASESAQSLRYEAVLETEPKMNSMVSIE